jgi:hypothetical protein
MKKNIILIIILLLIWWIYFWINYFWEQNRINNKITNFSFNKLKFNKIKTSKLEINNKKINYTWTWKIIVDQNKIDNFISELKEIKIKNIASTNKANFEKFWITASGSSVNIDNNIIFLWKNKWYFQEEYISIKWIDKVFLINKNLKNILDKDIIFFKKEEDKNKDKKNETRKIK